MKTIKLVKNLTHLIFTILCILLFENIAYAEEIKEAKKEIKNDGIFSIGMPLEIKYGIKDNFSIALSGDIVYSQVNNKYSLIQKNLNGISSNINLNFLYYFSRNKISPFIGISSGLQTRNFNSDLNKVTENILNVSFLSGVECFLTDNISISFDLGIGISKNLSPLIGTNNTYDEMMKIYFNINGFKAYYYFF